MSQGYILAVDTAGEFASAALYQPDSGRLYERSLSEANSHDEQLAAMTASLLEEASVTAGQISLLVTGAGPGSFTGLRIGLSFMKGLAMGIPCRLIQISSLEAYAQEFLAGSPLVFSVLDARRDEVFFASCSRQNPKRLIDEASIVKLSELPALIDSICTEHGSSLSEAVFCGQAPANWPAELPSVQAVRHAAASLCRLAMHSTRRAPDPLSISDLSPNYLRAVAARTIAEREAILT